MALIVEKQNNNFRLLGQGFSTKWLPNTKSNRKTIAVVLRYLLNSEGKPFSTFQELSPLFESENRQAASQHVEDFRDCGEDFLDFLKRRRKIDEEVTEVVKKVLREAPLLENHEIARRVNLELGRSDIAPSNMTEALKQIGCNEIRETLKNQLKAGKAHYKESYLLGEMMDTLSCEVGIRAGFQGGPLEEEMVVSDPTAIRKLITPGIPIEEISSPLKIVSLMMTLYYHNVPLSVLGRWFKVNKTTVLRWILGLALALWPIIYKWILEKVKAKKVYVDEKWLKIKKKWHYWFVVLDVETELPILAALLPSRTKWAIRWIGCKLKLLKKNPERVITDGLAGYPGMVEGAEHTLCRFHHQQSVTRFLKKNFEEEGDIKKRKPLMKKVLQTKDKRTVKRRMAKLEEKAESLGIVRWVTNTLKKLPSLLCSVGSSKIPSTSNTIERFFRSFNRFYKTRGGFHSVKSAKKELLLFLVVYLFTQRETGQAPIEKIMPEAREMPLYKLINDPFQNLWEVKNVKQIPKMAKFALTEQKVAQ